MGFCIEMLVESGWQKIAMCMRFAGWRTELRLRIAIKSEKSLSISSKIAFKCPIAMSQPQMFSLIDRYKRIVENLRGSILYTQ
jgi:hypothetical protein